MLKYFYSELQTSPPQTMRLPRSLSGKESACQCRRPGVHPWVDKISWRRKWQPTPVFLLRKSHGQTRLAGYGPRGWKESDTTEWLSTLARLRQREDPCAMAWGCEWRTVLRSDQKFLSVHRDDMTEAWGELGEMVRDQVGIGMRSSKQDFKRWNNIIRNEFWQDDLA